MPAKSSPKKSPRTIVTRTIQAKRVSPKPRAGVRRTYPASLNVRFGKNSPLWKCQRSPKKSPKKSPKRKSPAKKKAASPKKANRRT